LTQPPLQLRQEEFERAKRKIVPVRPFALARSGDIEDVDLIPANKFSD
jgi:hypothetical protein